MTTRSQTAAADVAALFKARNPLIWIVSREEARVERYIAAAAKATKCNVRTWDVADGFADESGRPLPVEDSKDPGTALNFIREQATSEDDQKRNVWIMRDLPAWLSGVGGVATLRQLRNLVRLLPSAPLEQQQSLVILTPAADVPAELTNHATVIEWPLPDREEIGSILDASVEPYGKSVEPLNGKREAAIDAAVGLSEEEAQSCYARSLVQLKRIDPPTVAKEKRRVIARERVLEWYDPLPGGLDAVGGLENLKAWLMLRKSAFSPEARAYGLPAPKGMLLVGLPGTGKTMTAKATSTAFACPLIRMDLGALKDKFVGGSEANIRKAQKVVEAIGRCVLWIDEIEKALQGATSGSSDGGTSADQLGSLLSWMQDQSSGAFVIATANDVTSLPPELLRKGRFDEIFWVDLPTLTERTSILAVTLRGFGKGAAVNLEKVAKATNGFTGSEINALVAEGMFTAFNDGARDVETDDLLKAAEETEPLSKTAADKVAKLRDWSKGKARRASADEQRTEERKVRALDLA